MFPVSVYFDNQHLVKSTRLLQITRQSQDAEPKDLDDKGKIPTAQGCEVQPGIRAIVRNYALMDMTLPPKN